jgi:uncharacterized protein
MGMGRGADNTNRSGGMTSAATAAWLGFLASPAAPKTARSPLELDGFLTGVIVSPQLIRPTQWILALWGEEDPVFDDEAQINLVLGAAMGRYNELITEIDAALDRLETEQVCDWRPGYMPDAGEPHHDTIREWAKGFYAAMALDPESWSAWVEDERMRILLAPFVGFVQFDDPEFEPADNIQELLDEAAAAIPRCVLVLRKIALMRSRKAQANPPRVKIGRNEPCPCGSGRKYKRCCGTT